MPGRVEYLNGPRDVSLYCIEGGGKRVGRNGGGGEKWGERRGWRQEGSNKYYVIMKRVRYALYNLPYRQTVHVCHPV